jgi:hypothetical protein
MPDTENDYDFGGIGPLNPVSDMHARVVYEALLYPWTMRMDHGDHFFTQDCSRQWMTEQGETSEDKKHEPVTLDAFAIRETFDRIDPQKPSDVLRFLNKAGAFWYLPRVSLQQIMEWQRFAKLVRRQDFMYLAQGILSSDARDVNDSRDAKQASLALEGFPNSFFVHSKPFTDWPPVHPEWPPELQQEALSSYREAENNARELRAYQMAFLSPQALLRPPGTAALQIDWQYADEESRTKHSQILAEQQQKIHMGRSQQEREAYWKRLKGQELKEAVMAHAPPEIARGTFSLKPAIVIRARNVLEAIAAANYIDLIRGVEWKRCALPSCKRIFEVKSNHGQKCCNGPRDTCRNTLTLQTRRRNPDKAKKERERARELAAKKKAPREQAAALERARQKKKAADKPTKGIQHPIMQTKRGSK